MAWTSPRTWLAGETVTASLLNTHVRDNLDAIGGAWTAWTPTPTPETGTWTAASAAGRYLSVGKLIMFEVTVTITTVGTGDGSVDIPAPVTARAAGPSCGAGRVTSNAAALVAFLESTSQIRLSAYNGGSIAGVGATTIVASGFYEAA